MTDVVETVQILEPVTETKRKDPSGEVVSVGRRKCARARVRLKPGEGAFTVNGQPIDFADADIMTTVIEEATD
ncbi:MAG TPA: 30S ribosomal protein S9, partial [Candidatus Hydrogenedentes bacterium]|nr:30S ribosomal protein S9 [Candidatus Hydrogenedentota bacterium]